MAGKVALMYRREEAKQRLTTALDSLMDRLGIDDLSIPLTGKDPDMLAVMQLEAMANVAEVVDTQIANLAAAPKKAPAPAAKAKDA